jgi:DNA polymerase III delta subunit
MELTVFVGDDDQQIRTRRAALLDAAGGATGRGDVAVDGPAGLLDAIGSPSLFGGRRVVAVDGIEALTDRDVDRMLRLAAHSDAVVVARAAGSLPVQTRDRLKTIGQVITCTAPKGRGVGARVEEMVVSSGVTLGPELRRMLVDRAGHDLDRVASVLRQLTIAQIFQPSRAQLDVLLGSAAPPGVPWALADAIEAGDTATAVTASIGLEPLAALGYLTSRATQIGQVVEASAAGAIDVGSVQQMLRLNHRFQAEKLLRVATRLGPDGSRQLWNVLGRADKLVKTTAAAAAFEAVVVELTAVFAPHRS